MISLAHISDVHLAPLTAVRLDELFSKRITGYVNWKLNRAKYMHSNTLQGLVDHLKAAAPDFIAVTGDLVNLAADTEIERAGRWLEELGDPAKVCVCPGNHDAYVAGALRAAEKRWKPYMSGEAQGKKVFPFIRRAGEVAIISCSSAVARPPFVASGYFSKGQAARLAEQLKTLGEEGLFRVVMIHHPPVRGYAKSMSMGLRGAKEFREVIAEHGAELILHGHLHHSTITSLQSPTGEVPVIGVAAASADASSGEQPARYNLFSIEKLATKWSCTLAEYGYQRIGDDIVKRLQMRLY